MTKPREWVLTLKESPQGHGYWARTFEGPSIGESLDGKSPMRVTVREAFPNEIVLDRSLVETALVLLDALDDGKSPGLLDVCQKIMAAMKDDE